jgi:hypothetical protein
MPRISSTDTRRGCAAAAQVNRQARKDHDAGILPLILALRAQGLSLTEIGGELMARGYPPRRGSYWHKKQLLRIVQRSQAANQNSANEIPPPNADPAATISAEGAIDAATIPLGGMAEPVTMPVNQIKEPVTTPTMETAESVTVPVDVHRHGVRQPVTQRSSDATPSAATARDDSAESIAMGVSHLPA